MEVVVELFCISVVVNNLMNKEVIGLLVILKILVIKFLFINLNLLFSMDNDNKNMDKIVKISII